MAQQTAVQFAELYDTPSAYSTFGFGFGSTPIPGQLVNQAVRLFTVPIENEVGALSYNQVNPAFPYIGQQHPDVPSQALVCKSLRTVARLVGGWKVVAEYGLPDVFGSSAPSPDRSSPNFSTVEFSSALKQMVIPYFLKVTTKAPLTNGDGTFNVFSYQDKTVTRRYPATEITITLNVPSFTADNALTITSMQNTMQLFPNGMKCLFLSGRAVQSTVTSWNLTYKWLSMRDPLLTAQDIGLMWPSLNNIEFVNPIPANGLPAFYCFQPGWDAVNNKPTVFIAPEYPFAWAPTTAYTMLPGDPVNRV